MRLTKILIFDVDYSFAKMLEGWLEQRGYDVRLTSEVCVCKNLIGSGAYNVAVVSVRYMDCDGMKLIGWMAKQNSNLKFAFAMDCDNNALTAQAFKHGAAEYIDKRALSANVFLDAIGKLHSDKDDSPEYMYRSDAYQECMRKAKKSYAYKDILLLYGEVGSGKSHIAKRVHTQALRHNHPFIQVKCSLLDEATSLRHLFGCRGDGKCKPVRGALSNVGAGTLFFDEIEKLPLVVQSLLAHVIEEGHFNIGMSSEQKTFCGKIMASTSTDLANCVAAGAFRRDLYDLISHNIVYVPPLRKCREDIVPFAEFFLAEYAGESKESPKRLSEAAKRHLLCHPWSGNIRELRSVISKAETECESIMIKTEHLRLSSRIPSEEGDLRQSILDALEMAGNNKTIASKMLGISRPTLYARMSKLNM